MIYNHRVLNPQEQVILRGLLVTYQKYDKIDLLIEMCVSDPQEVLKRKPKKKKENIIKSEPMPEELKFCNSDHCEYDPQDAGNNHNDSC